MTDARHIEAAASQAGTTYEEALARSVSEPGPQPPDDSPPSTPYPALQPTMSTNHLLPPEQRTRENIISGRRTGRTTSACLLALHKVISDPGRDYLLFDHHGTAEAREFMARRLQEMVDQLGLEHITVRHEPNRGGWIVRSDHITFD